MKRKKRRFRRRLLLLALLLAGGYAIKEHPISLSEHPEVESALQSAVSDPIDTVRSLLSGEPLAVQNLRRESVQETDPGHQEYFFRQLSEEQQRVYRQMLEGIRAQETEIYLTLSDEESINLVYSALLKDHPELYYIHNREKVYRTVYGESRYCVFSPGYMYSAEERSLIEAGMESAYQQVLAEIPADASDYEKTRIAYTWIVDHTDYIASEHDQSISGVFWKGEAVCAGYAGALQYLLERLDVPVIYVEGDTANSDVGHAWNIVTLDGEPYIVDVTNGDQPQFLEGDFAAMAEHKTTIYDYLCPFPEEYALTYTPSTEFAVPECTAIDKNFYVMNQACFGTYDWQEVYDLCTLRIDNNAAVIRFKFSTQEAFDQALAEWRDGESPEMVAQYYMQHNGLTSVQYHFGVLENLKTIYYIF